MTFILLIFLTAFLMEAIGSYVSVVGLGSLFAGDLVILTMAVILDVAKITSVSFLYQYWYDIKSLMRYYMLGAVIVLMTITSAGAFGYLSGAFQRAMQPNQEVMLKVESFNKERDQLSKELEQLTRQRESMDKQLSQLPPENVKGRRQLIWSFKPETSRISERTGVINKRIDQLNEEILKVEAENIDKQVHTGPITYVSKAFDISVEEASKWIILTIIFVFDPLAVILIIAGNFLVKRHNEHKELIEHVEVGVTSEDVLVEQRDSNFSENIVENLSDKVTHELQHQDTLEIKEECTHEWEDDGDAFQIFCKLCGERHDVELTLGDLDIDIDLEDQVEDNHEISKLIELVYDAIDTGEDPDDFLDLESDLIDIEDIDESPDPELELKVKKYVPIIPQDEVSYDDSESNLNILESLKVNLPSALFRVGVKTFSTKRKIYEDTSLKE